MSKRKPMTEQQWLTSTSPGDLLEYLRQHRNISRKPGGRRRLRLFGCACCRQHWDLFTDERCRQAVEVSERFADGHVRKSALQQAQQIARTASSDADECLGRVHAENRQLGGNEIASMKAMLQLTNAAIYVAEPRYTNIAVGIVHMGVASAWAFTCAGIEYAALAARLAEACSRQAVLVRDIFGNPFQAAPLHPGDLGGKSGSVMKIARTIYDQHRFDEMPILADALEDAGCSDPAFLDHCRAPAEHARGCWVLDALLGNA